MGNWNRFLNAKLLTCCLLSFLLMNILILFFLHMKDDKILVSDQNLTEFCKEENSPRFDDWQFIHKDFYIYSAYWEYRNTPPVIRIVGIGLNSHANLSHFICLLKYNEDNVTVSLLASEIITENHGMNYTAKFYFCRAATMPVEIAITLNRSYSQLTWIKVHPTEPLGSSSAGKIAVCVQPLFDKFPNNNLQIAEFIAYHQLIGASHFTFYNYHANEHLIQLLSTLKESDISLDLLPWTFPKDIEDIWISGQMASIVDCVYRCAPNYEFVLIIDVDEFIVPSEDITLQEIIRNADDSKDERYVGYMFPHTFFMEISDDPKSANISLPLLTQKRTRRSTQIGIRHQRSKSIIRPASIVVPGIHFSWVSLESWVREKVIDPTIAKVHHYRYKVNYLQGDIDTLNVVDRTATRYGYLLLQSKPIQIWKIMYQNEVRLTN